MGQVLTKILQCPDCGGRIDERLRCARCSRSFEDRDGIYHILPLKPKLPELPIHDDPDYRRYHSLQGQTDDYFYHNRNPLINWVQSSGYQVIKKLLRDYPGLTLECGCGTGVFLDIHPQINRANFVMLDLDERSLSQIKDRHLLGGVVRATNYQLPFQDHSLDVIISHAQLEHLAYLDWALTEIMRVLKPSGRFIASVPNEGGLFWSQGRKLTSARYFRKTAGIDYIRANRIDHFNTAYQVDRAIRRYFIIEKRVFLPFPWSSFHFNFNCTYVLRSLSGRAHGHS